MDKINRAAEQWKRADASRWFVASIAYRVKGKEVTELAKKINRSPDTVQRLARAYELFLWLCIDEYARRKTTAPVRHLRRKIPYTRWAVVYEAWKLYEMPISEAREYLEHFNGGNDALSAEMENRYGAPEWERRMYGVYKGAFKLIDDLGVPPQLRHAAREYCNEYNAWAKEQR